MKHVLSDIKDALQVLGTMVASANPDSMAIRQRFLEVQQLFQIQFLPLLEALSASSQAQVQPIVTEMNRTLRLLGMDVTFLQAARQSLTQKKRQRQMGDRIRLMLTYIQTLQQYSMDSPEL